MGRADSALAAAESVFTEVERRRQPLGRDERIDPNLADEAELDRLPGVGPVLARAIVRHRQRNLGHLRYCSLDCRCLVVIDSGRRHDKCRPCFASYH